MEAATVTETVVLVRGVRLAHVCTSTYMFIGYRNADNSRCEPCTQPLRAYDYFFLVFHAIVPLYGGRETMSSRLIV